MIAGERENVFSFFLCSMKNQNKWKAEHFPMSGAAQLLHNHSFSTMWSNVLVFGFSGFLFSQSFFAGYEFFSLGAFLFCVRHSKPRAFSLLFFFSSAFCFSLELHAARTVFLSLSLSYLVEKMFSENNLEVCKRLSSLNWTMQ